MQIVLKLTGIPEVQRELAALKQRPTATEVWQKVGRVLSEEANNCFTSQRSPDGKAWKRLSKATRKQRSKMGGAMRILQRTGAMRRSLYVITSPGRAEIGTRNPYAPVHQYGSASKRIPARPFIGLSIAGRQKIAQLLRTWITREV